MIRELTEKMKKERYIPPPSLAKTVTKLAKTHFSAQNDRLK